MPPSPIHDRALNPTERQAVEEWLNQTAKLMLLADWDIQVSADPPNEGADAEIGPVGPHCLAVAYVDRRIFAEPGNYAAKVLVHELVHLHHGDLFDVVKEMAERLDGDLGAVYEATITRYVERMVDQLARVFVDQGGLAFLPTPTLTP